MSGQDHGTPEPVNERILPIPPVVAGLFIASGWLLNHFVPLQDRSGPAATESRIAGGSRRGLRFRDCRLGIAANATLQNNLSSGRQGERAGSGWRFPAQPQSDVPKPNAVNARARHPERRPMDEPARTSLAALPPRARGEARRGVSYPEIWGGVCGLPEQGPALVLKKYRDVLLATLTYCLPHSANPKGGDLREQLVKLSAENRPCWTSRQSRASRYSTT